MKQLKQLLLVMAIALTGFTPAQAQYTHYSEWMANSRNYKVYKSGSYRTFTTSDGNSGDFWRYDDGLMYEAILDTYHRYETNTSLLEGVRDYLKWCFQGSSSPYIKNLETTTLDDMRPGRLVWKYKRTYSHSDTDYDSKYEAALSALMQTSAFANSSRVTINGNTGKGYPWRHKSNLGGQVWLDGIFMGLPFWTLAGPVIGSVRDEYSSWTTSDFFEDAVSQILKTDEKTYGDELGLWAHAWDGEGDEAWSTKNSSFTTGSNVPPHADIEKYAHDGRSSHCWGRALGWYAMAIMETMDNIQLQNGSGTYNTQINTLKPIFKKVMDKVIETRDPSSGVWYCVLDVGDNSSATSPYYRKGPKNNYLEATCSSMFAYCLLHGVAQGYLDSSYTTVAQDVYNSVVKEFIKNDSSNKKKLIRCDQVAGLGGTSTVNSITYNRDGSFAYYMLEDSIDNDSKGVGPFIWASLAAETTPYNYTIATGFPSIANDGIVQFRWSRVADDFTVPNTTPANFESPTFTAKTHGGSKLDNATNITFSSDNTKVATVDDNGNITLAGEAGTANIKATMTSGAYVGEAIYTVTTTGTDTTKPTLSSSTPATGATDVAVSGNIVLTFSEDVTINDASNITLTGGAGTLDKEHATTDGATITIPYSGLANSTTYTLNIAGDAVKDLADNTNDALENITFTTIAPDETAPTLSNQSIENNATNVSTSGTIVLTFSEEVTVANAAGITISPTTGVTWGTATVDNSDHTKVKITYSGLANSTQYTVSIASNAITDLAGNAYAGSNFSFTTSVSGTVEGSAGSSYLNIAQYTTIGTEGFDNSVENLYSYDSTNGVLVMIVYASQNSSNQKWITSSSVENTSSSWTSAPSPFKSSDFYKGSKSSTPKQAKVKSGSNITYKVTNCTKVSLYGKAGGNSEKGTIISAYIIDAEGNISNTASKTATISSTSNTSVALDGLISTEKYAIVITGENSGTAGYAYEIAFYTPNSTPSTYTLTNTVNPEGYGTVSPTTVANIPSGTATTSSSNTYTVGGTEVTATPTAATAEYTYAFSGWSGLPETVTANKTVTAIFTRTAKEYTLAWNSNGGSALSGDYTSGTVPFGTAITAPNNPTRDGYTFSGWNTDDDGSGTPLGSTMPAANTTYYAQWTENTLPTAPEFSPEEGNVNGGTEVSITSTDATTIYYQISESSTPPSVGGEGWSTYSSTVALPNITGTRYLYAYGSNATGNSSVSSATYTLTKVKAEAGLAYNTSSVSKTVGDANFTNALTNPNSLSVTYSITTTGTGSSIDSSTGEVTVGSTAGTETITATFDGNDDYNAGNATYTLTVNAGGGSTETTVVFKSSTKDDSNVNLAELSNGNTRLVGGGVAKLIAANSVALSTSANKYGYRCDGSRLYIVFKFDGETDLSIQHNANSTGERYMRLYSFSSNKELSAITSSDWATKEQKAFTSTNTTTTWEDGQASVVTPNDGKTTWNYTTKGCLTVTWKDLPAGYYVLDGTGSEAYIYSFTANIASSSSPTPTYTVTATSNNNSWGTVSVDKATAAEGATVTITTSPASGYELTSLTATDGDSNPVTINSNNQFTMPASDVTVNATFAALPPVLGAVTFSPAGGNYSSEQNVTISATNAEEIWYSTVSQAAAVKNGANATQYTSAIHIGEGSTTLYATAYLGESTTTGSATYTVTIPDVGDGTEIYEFTINSNPKTITFTYGDKENISITNSSCEQGKNEKGYDHTKDIKFNWHNTSKNTQGKFTINSSLKPIQSIKLVATIEGDEQNAWGETETVHQNVAVTNGTYDSETMTWTANSDDVTSVTFTNNYDATYNGNIYISKIIVVYYASETITIAEAGFSTLYKTYAVSVGEGGTAYYVSDIQNKNVVLTPFTNNIIPANTGAVIKGNFGDEVTLNRAIADDFTATNYLLGTDTKQNITADKDTYYYFISGRQKQPDNSYKYGWLVPNTLKTTSVFSNNANKAYLQIPKSMLDSETAARMLTLVWEDYEQPIATGIDGFATDNGFIVIDDNTPLYNLSGQRVSKSYKGIVIVNGKKVLRK